MSTSARFTGAAGKDNTDRNTFNDYQAPAFAATIALVIKPNASNTLIVPATLTGIVTFSANVGTATTPPYIGDTINMLLVSDGTSRVVTFGTGFLPTGTLSVTTAKYATISFVFNGTGWLETSRAVSA
jgi:hypothetical protein